MNINNNEDKNEFLQKYHTPDGINAMKKRLNSLIELYIKKSTYPIKVRILGFPTLFIENEEFHKGMMLNMANILGMSSLKIEVKNDS